ncbi:MAG TPA: DMT family transporter [Pseudonocardia sp.]|nr:DMT family transporter [Pseudonocardia sp.]
MERSPGVSVLCGAACIAASAVLIRLSGSSAGAVAFFRCAFALVVLAMLVPLDRSASGRPPLPRRARWFARWGGVLFAGDLILLTHTINAVGAGLATVLANLQVLFVGLIAWWVLRERPSRFLVAAMPLVIVGVALVGGLGDAVGYGPNPMLGVGFGLGASLLYAGFILLLRHGQTLAPRSGAVRPLFEAMLGATVGSAVLAAVLQDFRLGPLWPSLGWLALLACSSQVLGWLLISASLPKLPAALTSLLLLIQPIGAMALAAAVFGEHPSVGQLAGVAVLLAGIVAASAGEVTLAGVRRLAAGWGARPVPGREADGVVAPPPASPPGPLVRTR